MLTAAHDFKKTGEWPVNRDVFQKHDFLPADTTHILLTRKWTGENTQGLTSGTIDQYSNPSSTLKTSTSDFLFKVPFLKTSRIVPSRYAPQSKSCLSQKMIKLTRGYRVNEKKRPLLTSSTCKVELKTSSGKKSEKPKKFSLACSTIFSGKNMKRVRTSLGKVDINAIKDENGSEITNREKILRTTGKLYKDLYEQKQTPPDNVKKSLKKAVMNEGSEDIPDISDEQIMNKAKAEISDLNKLSRATKKELQYKIDMFRNLFSEFGKYQNKIDEVTEEIDKE
ncbi:hypothetical protein ILUMI_02756 [Ignelater luminosus]|uniref:Uncharacterized protein n=1 Tax=Ignelater luminosus TaxID=2038154 RepID=A0A8K0DN61_IGNLU|nr:hypothetical protein ILUMI_02756 [Ignelater luminosus]